jgi:hypothetical protein
VSIARDEQGVRGRRDGRRNLRQVLPPPSPVDFRFETPQQDVDGEADDADRDHAAITIDVLMLLCP